MKIGILPAIFWVLSIGFVVGFLQPVEAKPYLYLTGQVVSKSTGKPVSSVWVEVYRSGNRVGRSLTGNDGSYYISDLKKGSYEVIVVKQGQELIKRSIDLKENRHLDIEL